MPFDATVQVDATFVKKVLAKKENYVEYLQKLYSEKEIGNLIPNGLNDLVNTIVETWDYPISKQVIRQMYLDTQKYNVGAAAFQDLENAKEDWNALSLGDIKWPFAAMNFDGYIQSINTRDISELDKDIIVTKDVIRFRRIKKINTLRNDYIEYLIVTNNENVIPTLEHRRSVDFYINGKPFDQKVSKSVTKKFMDDYSDVWFNTAITNPSLVAKYLYEQQDEGRFGCEPRLLIVYLSDDISADRIANIVQTNNFETPLSISFEYTINGITTNYITECFIVLLY